MRQAIVILRTGCVYIAAFKNSTKNVCCACCVRCAGPCKALGKLPDKRHKQAPPSRSCASCCMPAPTLSNPK